MSLSLKPFDDVGSVEAREVIVQADDFAYYDLFLNVRATLRDSCYACPFAAPVRPADITVGDFWGVRENRPDVLEDLRYDSGKGVSCLLVNTERGRTALSEYGGELDLFEVSFEDIAKGNDHLRHPSELPSDRVLYLKAFSNGGWDAVEELWKKRERGASYMSKKLMKRLLPKGLIRHAKTMLEKKRSDEK